MRQNAVNMEGYERPPSAVKDDYSFSKWGNVKTSDYLNQKLNTLRKEKGFKKVYLE